MSFSRLYRLLKPALLCGALAAPGLASTMVPWAGRVGRAAADATPRGQSAAQPALALQCASRDDWRCARSMHEFSAKDIDGRMVNLDKYRGHVCIVTNVASQ
ncbi:unnamed protein product [Rangifer tarandus platyrhynchus]|uniref:Phospholipid hydroperoxide glutathione peroxidase, mitochondrial n=1 Tax=Rangifer tarandus platyrhynchus TaxID=3082113 RepID=A0ABN8ZBN7_RANTA|nr:unnamed protein product [Rangifer tarandus platyrhynchus]